MLLALIKIFVLVSSILTNYKLCRLPAVRTRRSRVAADQVGTPTLSSHARLIRSRGIKLQLQVVLLQVSLFQLERLADVVLVWVPFYEQAKILAWIYILLTRNMLAPQVFDQAKRVLRSHEPQLDLLGTIFMDVVDIVWHLLKSALQPVMTRFKSIYDQAALYWFTKQDAVTEQPHPASPARKRISPEKTLKTPRFPGAMPFTPMPFARQYATQQITGSGYGESPKHLQPRPEIVIKRNADDDDQVNDALVRVAERLKAARNRKAPVEEPSVPKRKIQATPERLASDSVYQEDAMDVDQPVTRSMRRKRKISYVQDGPISENESTISMTSVPSRQAARAKEPVLKKRKIALNGTAASEGVQRRPTGSAHASGRAASTVAQRPSRLPVRSVARSVGNPASGKVNSEVPSISVNGASSRLHQSGPTSKKA